MRIIRYLRTFLSLALVYVVFSVCSSMQVAAGPIKEVILASEVKWEPLNPARGDKSPMAGTLWGDRKGSVPTGFLVKFAQGFSSPPHIHNVSYRGIVINGLIHNDDPSAADMWMPTGSFWTQPKGEVHITAAKDSTNVAYIEIESGPYLVLPTEKAFDSGERPVNVDASNIVWLETSNTKWGDQPGASTSADQPKVAFLWGIPQGDQLNGSLIKLPAGFTGKIHTHGSTFRAVVAKGQLHYQVSKVDSKTLMSGSYFSSEGESVHSVSSQVDEESTLYVRTNGKFKVIQSQLKK
ncbi:MAG: DUF4437 domain-containing protein [Candidatus Thiodiazotropha sp. DIVDIV]